MRLRLAAACTVAALVPLTGCGGGETPSPGVTPAYDPVIAFCSRMLNGTLDVCDHFNSTALPTVYAHVLMGHADGHELEIHIDVVRGGHGGWDEPPDQIPTGHSWKHTVQLDRDRICTSRPCTVKVKASIDGELVAVEKLTFT